MKIEKKSLANVVPFENLFGGVVFKDKNGAVCMKFESNYQGKFDIRRNAINLDTGSLYLYDDDEEVEVLEDAVLTY